MRPTPRAGTVARTTTRTAARVTGVAAVTTAVLLGAIAAPAQASHDYWTDDFPLPLTAAKNLDATPDGALLTVGPTVEGDNSLLKLTERRGTRVREIATLPAGQVSAAARGAGGETWVVYGESEPGQRGPSAIRIGGGGDIKEDVDIAAFQAANPDPYSTDPPGDSNPYDVEVLRDGSALVVDAANNNLLRISRDGRIWIVACFPLEEVSTADVPPFVLEETGPLPPTLQAEAVPTGVTYGWGRAYVSELKGFPFAANSSRVWRVDPFRTRQGCTPGGSVTGTVVASGLSAANDITIDPRGTLYVTELSSLGTWAVEGAFADLSSVAGTGRVTKIARNGDVSTVGEGELTLPGSSAVVGKDLVVLDQFLFAPTLRTYLGMGR